MRKSDKKLEKSIVAALNEACDDALEVYAGFQWLTHVVNYNAFPDSLTVICVFDSNDKLGAFIKRGDDGRFRASIEERLASQGIKIKDVKKRVVFDTEEACEREHDGNWTRRLEGVQHARHV